MTNLRAMRDRVAGPRPRGLAVVLSVGLALLWASGDARAVPLKIATWNLDWLTLRATGDPILPDDVQTRSPADFMRLAGYAARLDADVAALEEVDGAAPAALVFPPGRYRILTTSDHVVQRVVLAVRDGIAVEQHPDVTALDVEPTARFRLRSGLDATLTIGGTVLRLLAVHLKSGCWSRTEAREGRPACAELERQVPVLAAWIASRRREGVPYLVLGDFNRRLVSGDPVLDALRDAAGVITSATAGHADPCWDGHRDFIDQILVGGPARDWVVADSLRVMVYRGADPGLRDRISDHCPVSIRMEVPAD